VEWTWSLLLRQQLHAAQARGLESAHEPAGCHVSIKDMDVWTGCKAVESLFVVG
jgi:hypothetical protein